MVTIPDLINSQPVIEDLSMAAFREYKKKALEDEINELIEVAELFYTRIKKWNPDISESEAKKIALNIAVAKKYEPRLDVSTVGIDNHLENISGTLSEIAEHLEKS